MRAADADAPEAEPARAGLAPVGMIEVLFLRLEGPLMSWGENSRWTVRDTRREPTKSGVVGILASCLGLGKTDEDDREIALLANGIVLGVRADRPGTILRDYHTVTGFSRASGTIISERSYLADACFLVALAGEAALLDRLERGLGEPKWPPFLGRKSCPPAAPIYPALANHPSRERYSGLVAALNGFPYLGREGATGSGGSSEAKKELRAVIELAPGERAPANRPTQRRRDVPLSFLGRRFADRYVYEEWLNPRGKNLAEGAAAWEEA